MVNTPITLLQNAEELIEVFRELLATTAGSLEHMTPTPEMLRRRDLVERADELLDTVTPIIPSAINDAIDVLQDTCIFS